MTKTIILTAEQNNDVKTSRKCGAQDILDGISRLPLANETIKTLVEKYSTKDHTFSYVIKAIFEAYTNGKTIARLATKANNAEFPSAKRLQEIINA